MSDSENLHLLGEILEGYDKDFLPILSSILSVAPVFICIVNSRQEVVFISQHFSLLKKIPAEPILIEAAVYPEVLYHQISMLPVHTASTIEWSEVNVNLDDVAEQNFQFCKILIEGAESSLVMTLGVRTNSEYYIESDLAKYKNTTQHLAFKDPLTGLANRALFYDRLNKTISSAKRDKRHFAVMLIDIDHFKEVNDCHGRDVGDLYLKFIAEKFRDVVRDVDTVARIGADKFVIILDNIKKAENIRLVADKLLDVASSKFTLGGVDVTCTASMGISLYPKDGRDADQLLKYVDMAVSKAKAAGKNQHKFFINAMTESAVNYLLLENDLQNAIAREELALYFQPQVNVISGQICGVEVLCRWQHPKRGLLQPGHFIPLAEETGLIEPLGEWVLRRSCELFKQWMTNGYDFGKLSVNVSAKQFRSADFEALVSEILDKSGLPEARLELEITESATMENAAQAIENLTRLYQSGISIALDDFGTGYSSLAYLQKFPVHKLKIDKSFVKDIDRNETSAATAKSIIDLANNMSLDVIAEGVERKEQAKWLESNGCYIVQGDYYSPPLSSGELAEMAHNKSRAQFENGVVRLRR